MKDRKPMQLRLPPYLKDWIEEQSELNGSSKNSEIVRAIRERMIRSAEALQELQYAAERSGVSTDQLNTALTAMVKNVGKAAKGTGEAKRALADLGLEAEALAKLSPDEQLYEIANAMKGVQSPTRRTALLMEIFGDAGARMAVLLDEGSEGMDQMRQEARELGHVLSDESLRDAEAFSDAFGDVGKVLQGLKNTIGAELMPVMTDMFQDFTAWFKENRNTVREFAGNVGTAFKESLPIIRDIFTGVAEVAEVVGKLASKAADMVGGWDKLGVAVGALFVAPSILAVGKLGASIVGLVAASGPVGWVIAGVAAAATLIIANWDEIKAAGIAAWDALKDGASAAVDWVVSKFQWLSDRVSELLAPIRNSLTWVGDKIDTVGNWWNGDRKGSQDPAAYQNPIDEFADVPRHAVGGSFRKGPIIVGERGPELRFESRAGFIATNRQMQGLASAADRLRGVAMRGAERAGQILAPSFDVGGISIHAAPGMDPRAIAAEVLRTLREAERGALYDRGIA